MANRKIYNQLGVYAGTCISTGFHFVDPSGYLVNSQFCQLWNGLTGYSTNLVRSLTRVNSASYSFNESRTDVRNFGTFGTLTRPILTTPPVSLNLSYYSNGLYNEEILGFFLSSGVNTTPISGYLDRTYRNPNNVDSRNIFIVTNDSHNDLKSANYISQNLNGTTSNILKDNIYTYAFGDCFLDSWKYSAEIFQFPQVEASFTCENLIYYSGGSGKIIPSANCKDFSLRTGVIYNLPPLNTGIIPTILLPGDITTSITEVSGTNYIQNLPVSFTDIKLQKFDISLVLNREPLNNLGFRLPSDRRINPPVYANVSYSAIVGDAETGFLIDFINKDTNYNIDISMKYTNQPVTGIGIDFKFLGAKFNNINISESINQKRLCDFSFTSELTPNSSGIGFFISGQLPTGYYNTPINWPPPSPFILSGTGFSYTQILLNWTPSFSTSSNVTYSLYRSTGVNFTPNINNLIINNLNTLTYLDMPTSSGYGITYYYYAQASDAYGLSTFSNEASGTTFFPPAPTLFSINPSGNFANVNFNPDVFGVNFTNIGNETLTISGSGLQTVTSNGTGLSFIDTGHLIRSGLSLNSGVYTLTYANNYGSSTLISGLRICLPPLITGFNPSSIPYGSATGFSIDFYGTGFTNNGNELLYLQNTGLNYSGTISYINGQHIIGSFHGNPSGYTQGQYSGYYMNNCTDAFFTGIPLSEYGFYVTSIVPNYCPGSDETNSYPFNSVINGFGFQNSLISGIAFSLSSPVGVTYSMHIAPSPISSADAPFTSIGIISNTLMMTGSNAFDFSAIPQVFEVYIITGGDFSNLNAYFDTHLTFTVTV